MIGHLPPYALSTSTFRFRALASHAGRAALGGDREIALACFAVARLCSGLLPPVELAPHDAATRATSTRHWLASMSLSAGARLAAQTVIDAVSARDLERASRSLIALLDAAARQLDAGSVAEIRELVSEMNGSKPLS